MATLGDNNDFSSFLDVDLDLDYDYSLLHIDSNQNQQPSEQQHHGIVAHNDDLSQVSAVYDFGMPMDMQFTIPQNLQHVSHHTGVPPTPNSAEMHGEHTAEYLQQFQAHQLLMQQYQMKRIETQRHTPLMSPAHENFYDLSAGFTAPGAYFSPLTSPAMEGQQPSYQMNGDNSMTTMSNNHVEVDMQDRNDQKPQAAPKPRKRPGPVPRSATATNRVKNSPAMKAQSKRKSNASSLAVTDATGMRYIPSPNIPASAYSNDSVSPEPLSESMGPPLKPASATHSPAIVAKNQRGYPASPASFLASSTPVNGRALHKRAPSKVDERPPPMPDLTLPEAADPLPDGETDDDGTCPRKTPKIGLLSTPSGSVTPQANFSMTPISTISSPMSSNFPQVKKPETKSRMSKKRGSVSTSVLISPALRPRISPSIKPLLPEGSVAHDDAHAAFLASRSNYQNLIEGTHVPGVSYPTELSTNLTSKRTSHKIAEQGRRNRINTALQEIARLLPQGSDKSGDAGQSPSDDEEGSGSGKKGDKSKTLKAISNSSKASTVESAIAYIRTLKKEHEEKDKECEALRLRLKAMERQIEEKGLAPDGDTSSESQSS